MGPAHPATHGTVRIVLELDGERIVRSDVQVGYLHRGFEKMSERACWTQVFRTLIASTLKDAQRPHWRRQSLRRIGSARRRALDGRFGLCVVFPLPVATSPDTGSSEARPCCRSITLGDGEVRRRGAPCLFPLVTPNSRRLAEICMNGGDLWKVPRKRRHWAPRFFREAIASRHFARAAWSLVRQRTCWLQR